MDTAAPGDGGIARENNFVARLGRGDEREAEPPFSGRDAGRIGGKTVRSFQFQARLLAKGDARAETRRGETKIEGAESAAATRAMATAATDAFPGVVKIPVLMLAAARDEVVSTTAIEQLGVRMRTGNHLVIASARHELLMENDAIRGQVLAAFDAFITEQTGL